MQCTEGAFDFDRKAPGRGVSRKARKGNLWVAAVGRQGEGFLAEYAEAANPGRAAENRRERIWVKERRTAIRRIVSPQSHPSTGLRTGRGNHKSSSPLEGEDRGEGGKSGVPQQGAEPHAKLAKEISGLQP